MSPTMSRLCSGLSYRVRHEFNLVDGIIFPISPAYPSYISPVESTRNPTLPYSSCCWATAAAYLRLQPRVRFRHRRRSSASSSQSSSAVVLRALRRLWVESSFVLRLRLVTCRALHCRREAVVINSLLPFCNELISWVFGSCRVRSVCLHELYDIRRSSCPSFFDLVSSDSLLCSIDVGRV